MIDNAGNDKERHQGRDNEDAAAEKNARDQSEAAENFQPWQIEREPNPDWPRQHFVVVDIPRELDRIDDLDDAGVDK